MLKQRGALRRRAVFAMMVVLMKFALFILLGLGLTLSSVQAYELSVTNVTTPYEIVPLKSELSVQQAYLGSLEEFPIMYEVKVISTSTLVTQVAQLYGNEIKPIPFSLMVVRLNDANDGVTEVARITPVENEWLVKKDPVLGFSLWESDVINTEIGAGTYRVEVSTPDNRGRYRLMIGDQDVEKVGYFTTLGQIYTTQSFFDYSFLRLFLSSYVYYPASILLILYIFYCLKYRRKSQVYVA